ncbi:thiopeptide maturation pyridine synthase [Kitasatospora viridis]|uniref:Lantibiotic biosynthesis dehydratase-like protein n=1 Tax=Kitasatospora viridis TaxID=281105 RepID=A0A561TVP1_9ACTN|nr:thiopeptide maturation pyridine synthase [Kitasatospora viridis]TWF91171.1 lantibiotic biosynthesis dehydratase-like protein [Kitasatospora viridis]
MTESLWRTVNVYHHDADRTDLVLDAVRPFIAAVAPSVSRVYYQPHWRRGPHVRIPIQASAEAFDAVVAPAAAEVLATYLRAHPSTVLLDEQASHAQHVRLAEQERERGPLTPWAPNNSIGIEPYDRRENVLGGLAAADLLADYYVDTNQSVFDILDWVRAGGSKMALAVDMFIAVANRFLPPVTYGYMSFRGHADAFLAKMPDGLRERFDRVYEGNADLFRQRVVEITGAAEYHDVLLFSDLPDILLRYRNQANELIETGELALDTDDNGDPEEWGSTWTAWSDRSPFHQALGGHRAAADQLGGWDEFRRYRVVLNWLYLNMYRLGIGELERNLICHVVSRAVEDVHGVTAMERIQGLIGYVESGGRL